MRQQALGLPSVGERTDFYEGRASVSDAQALGKITGPLECVAVILQNRLNNLDDSPNPLELMVGTGAGCVWQMLPGVESPIIYCNNLNDIWVKVRMAVASSMVDALGAVEEAHLTLSDGGAGYTAGDILTLNAGNGGARIRVLTVTLGVITTWELISGGEGYPIATGVSATGGTGDGAEFDIDEVLLSEVAFPFMVYSIDPVMLKSSER